MAAGVPSHSDVVYLSVALGGMFRMADAVFHAIAAAGAWGVTVSGNAQALGDRCFGSSRGATC